MRIRFQDWCNLVSVQDSVQSPEPGTGLGRRLRSVRRAYGLSQRELARRAGITNATVSNVESEQVSPSVASLSKIVGAVGLSLAEFFAWDPTRRLRWFHRAAELNEAGSGGLSQRFVGLRDPRRRLQLAHERYAVGADTGPGLLEQSGEKAGLIIRGELTVTVGSMTRVLKAGDAYCFPGNIPHRFCNLGADLCELVSVATPTH